MVPAGLVGDSRKRVVDCRTYLPGSFRYLIFFAALIGAFLFISVLISAGLLPAGTVNASNEPQSFSTEPLAVPPKVLIVHDQTDDPQLAKELAALLGHFQAKCDITEQIYYEPGSLAGYDAVFYLGGTHKPINADFLNDSYQSPQPVVWMGRGLDWLAADHPLSKYGLSYSRVDSSGILSIVRYKETSLTKTNPITSIATVTDPAKAVVLAWVAGGNEKEPYIIRSGNFWYFADIPMIGTTIDSAYSAAGATEDSAYLALADLLHDIMHQDHTADHSALLRIEDVHPKTDIDSLNSVVEYLYQNGIPFGLGLVPVYINPATGEEIHLADRPEFVQAIKNAQSKGAVIVLHGYTHQRVGETVVDYEFWDSETHAPPIDETPENISARVDAALRETYAQGIYPSVWETPHYAASDLTHSIVAKNFGVVWERRDAPFFPYPVMLPQTGQIDLPETLGYINPQEGHDARLLLNISQAQLVVRDGVAAAFFHPALVDQDQLRQLVSGLQTQGYDFISPTQVAGLTYNAPEPPSWFAHSRWLISDRLHNLMGDKGLDSKIVAIVAFFIIFYYWGIFLLSRKPSRTKGIRDPNLAFVIVVPCLNEELVIGKTLEHLLSLPGHNLYILVVDDDSDDRTREIALSFPRDRLQLIDHPRSEARQGKGRVLNYAFKYLMASELVRHKGTHNVIVGVLDADGRVESNIIEAVNPLFHAPRAGAVQVGVRISNAQTNTLTKWQNFEFLTFARISQKAREYLGSVGLGGNGQFVRLSALATLKPEPWTDCLTEDLDLGIRLMLGGWQNHYSPDTFVSQQGVTNMRALIRQRTRWFQGHITCWRHIPALLARKSPTLARTDTIYYLLAPVLVFLFMPGSIMFIFWSIYFVVTGASSLLLNPLNYIPAVLVWYLFSFGALPTVVWTFWREEKDISAWRAFLWAHIFAFFYVIWFVAGVKAIYRLARGEGAWAKTARTEELHES